MSTRSGKNFMVSKTEISDSKSKEETRGHAEGASEERYAILQKLVLLIFRIQNL